MNPNILAILQQHGFFGGGLLGDPQPVPVMQTQQPQGLLGSVGAMPNNGGGAPPAPMPSPTPAPLPPDPTPPQPGPSFQQKYAPMLQTAANILNRRSAPVRPQPFLRPLLWPQQGGGY